MWDRAELKAQGKAAFRLNYWKCVLVSAILGFLTAATTTVSATNSANQQSQQEINQAADNIVNQIQAMPHDQQVALAAGIAGGITMIMIVSILIKIFVYNPLTVGCYSFFTRNVAAGPADLSSLGIGFRRFGHTFATLFLKDLFLTLWSLLFFIPGLIKSYSYRMVPYILADNPELSATETITLSRRMMDGHKMNAFILDLSFIGWVILTILSFGLVGIFWYGPYKDNTDAALYLAIKDNVQ